MSTEFLNLLSSFSNKKVKIRVIKDDIITIIVKKKNYNIKIKTVKDKLIIISLNEDNFDENHLCKLLNNKKWSECDVIEFANYLKDIVCSLTDYCINCNEKLDFKSKKYANCGKEKCQYKYEEVALGNPVCDKVKDSKDISRLLLDTAFGAACCRRKIDIFEPFPKHFLSEHKVDIDANRGKMSALKGTNYNSSKKFNELDTIILKYSVKYILDKISESKDDKEFEKTVGTDAYKLIRFVLTSCKVDICIDHENSSDGMLVHRIIHPTDKNMEFNELKKKSDNKTYYLFHGSKKQNWYSILRNGLKNCSKTKLMTAGAAYGNGIYFSNDINLSYGYGRSTGNTSYVGIFELIGKKGDYQQGKNHTVFVVPNEKILIQRFLVKLTGNSKNIFAKMNKFCSTDIEIDKRTNAIFLSDLSKKRIIRELKKVIKSKTKYGFEVTLKDNDVSKWTIYLSNFNKDDTICTDLTKKKIEKIELELVLSNAYPIVPPFVRVICPNLKGGTGNVVKNGAICMRVLSEKHWAPSFSIETLIVMIRTGIANSRLATNQKKVCTEEDAKKSFIKIMKGNDWV